MTMTEYAEDRRMDCEGLNAVRLAAMILVLLGLETAIRRSGQLCTAVSLCDKRHFNMAMRS